MTDAPAALPIPRLLTIAEAAERLGVRRRKIYELMNTGELASVKLPPRTIQSARRIAETELMAFIERNTEPASQVKP